MSGCKFRHFCFFANFCKQTNLRVQHPHFKYDNSFFSILAQKYLNNTFLVKNTQIWNFLSQILTFLFLRKILQLDKFEGIDFKCNNSFLKFCRKNTQTGIFGPKFRHCFFVKFYKQTNLRVMISNVTIAFLILQPQNAKLWHLWCQIQAFGLFQNILQLDKFKGSDFKYDMKDFLSF